MCTTARISYSPIRYAHAPAKPRNNDVPTYILSCEWTKVSSERWPMMCGREPNMTGAWNACGTCVAVSQSAPDLRPCSGLSEWADRPGSLFSRDKCPSQMT